MNLPMRRIVWHARRFVRMLGWPGMLAAMLFSLCAGGGYFVLLPLRHDILLLQKEVKDFGAVSRMTLVPAKRKLTQVEQLDQFYRFFPLEDALPGVMTKVYAAAAEQNLNLEQGEYRLVRDHSAKLTRYEITLPVKGGYLQLRKFLARVLIAVPSLSLDGMSFGRKKVDDAVLEAQLRFTLYLDGE